MNEEMKDAFNDLVQNMIRSHVEQTWTITEEISGNGNLFTRAVCKIAPVEVINCERGQFELTLN